MRRSTDSAHSMRALSRTLLWNNSRTDTGRPAFIAITLAVDRHKKHKTAFFV